MLKVGYGKEKWALHRFNSLKIIAKGQKILSFMGAVPMQELRGFFSVILEEPKEPLDNLWTRSQEKQQVHCNVGKMELNKIERKGGCFGGGIFECCGELVGKYCQMLAGSGQCDMATCVCNWCLSKLSSYLPSLPHYSRGKYSFCLPCQFAIQLPGKGSLVQRWSFSQNVQKQERLNR